MEYHLENIIVEEYITEGIIAIDSQGTILKYNRKAKEIFGLTGEYDYVHGPGSIREGDLVIFADTNLGADDGEMDAATLKQYGIDSKGYAECKGKGLLYIGIKGRGPIDYCMIDEHQKEKVVALSQTVDGLTVACRIDYKQKMTAIEVGDKTFEVDYLMDISNLVLVRNGNVIFYQRKGYSTRQESLKDILAGKPFIGKEGSYDIPVIGRNILEYHIQSKAISSFLAVASGKMNYMEANELIGINGYFVMGRVRPIDSGGERVGAILIIEDISTLIKSRKERDEALSELEKLKRFTPVDFFPEIDGVSLAINETKRLAAKAAASDANVMILGESGTGKSHIAREIHQKSTRADNPFIEINCSSIPSELIESELFGYAPGAFTSASNSGKKGLFEMADTGTIFMDEIGDIPLSMQSKLLLFVQNRKFYKVGGSREITVDIRIITATNKELETEVREKRFREDLFYRFHVLPIYIEPLRNRREDLGILIDRIMDAKNRSMSGDKTLSSGARRVLMEHDYPGNIREMENIIERAFVLCDGNIIYDEHLMLGHLTEKNHLTEESGQAKLCDLLKEYEHRLIVERLEAFGDNHKETYESLGIGKTSFYEKLKKFNG